MKMNKKGFTLIELLAVISMIAIVLALGFTFIPDVIDNSKEKAYNTSLKGLYKSATVYANEFLEDEDWVSNGVYEYSCVNTWWLVNKGLEDKKIFSDNSNDEYKFRKNDVIVLTRNASTKAITSEYLNSAEVNINCNNIIRGELKESSVSYDSIEVTGTCKIKNTPVQNATYSFCNYKGNNDNIQCTRWENSNNNKYTLSNLIPDSKYSIYMKCTASDGTESDPVHIISYTKSLPTPEITCPSSNNNIVTIDFKDANLNKEVKIDTSNVNINVEMFSQNFNDIKEITSNTNTTCSNKLEYFDISNALNSIVKFTATVSKSIGKKLYTRDSSKVCSRYDDRIYPPHFETSDEISSGNYHEHNFNLEIIDSSENENTTVQYGYLNNSNLYTTSDNNFWQNYNSPISVSEDDTYYARSCSSTGVCSEIVDYEAKIGTNRCIVFDPHFRASDNLSSGNPHSENFTLFISSNLSGGKIEYSTKSDPTWRQYNNAISVSEEDTYYARTCTSCCSPGTTYYVVKMKPNEAKPKAPWFVASDDISSGKWHKNNFTLNILSNNSNDVVIKYYSSKNYIEKPYLQSISVIDNKITYYAKACKVVNGNEVCSSVATYVAKIDKTPPVIELKLENTKTAEVVNEKYYSNTKDNSLIWLPYNVTLYYTFSDNEVGIDNSTAEFKYNLEYQKQLVDSEKLINDKNVSINLKSYSRSIRRDGDRKVSFKICDLAGNCSEKTTYFRTDTAKPIIYIDNESDLNNNKFRFRCDVLSGLSGSVIYQDHVERKGFVAHGQDGYAIANDNNTSDDDDDYVDYLYDGSQDIYAMCTNKAGTCTKIKAKIDSSKQSGCKLIYGTMPYTNGFSDSNPCYTSGKSCGYPLYFGCDVYDGLIHYKQYIYETTTHKEFVTEEEESC